MTRKLESVLLKLFQIKKNLAAMRDFSLAFFFLNDTLRKIFTFFIEEMSVYSFSQLQLFQQCPRKYQYKYVDQIKEKEFESSPDLILGSSVHKALENLYKNINVFKIPQLEEVIEDFHKVWDEEMTEATKEKPLQIKGQQTLEDYIRRGEHYVQSYYGKFAPFENVKIIGTEEMMHFQLDEAGNQKFRGVIDRIDKE
jgi:ATP-dependent helicase/DNAse subunit B